MQSDRRWAEWSAVEVIYMTLNKLHTLLECSFCRSTDGLNGVTIIRFSLKYVHSAQKGVCFTCSSPAKIKLYSRSRLLILGWLRCEWCCCCCLWWCAECSWRWFIYCQYQHDFHDVQGVTSGDQAVMMMINKACQMPLRHDVTSRALQ